MSVLKQTKEIVKTDDVNFEQCPVCESYHIKETQQRDFYCFRCRTAWVAFSIKG